MNFSDPDLFVYCCDISETAIQLVTVCEVLIDYFDLFSERKKTNNYLYKKWRKRFGRLKKLLSQYCNALANLKRKNGKEKLMNLQ